jgi:hypothetical protein
MKLLSITLLLLLGGSSIDAQQVNIDTEVIFETCYDSLRNFDTNQDRLIDRREYFGFAKDFGGRSECLGNINELPIELILVWNQLSCECNFRGGAEDCCTGDNARVPTQGARSADKTVIGEQNYLRQVCLLTDQAIISFCGPPPPPPQATPPPVIVQARAIDDGGDELDRGVLAGIILAGLLLLLILYLCCCHRRRWCLCAGKKYENDDSSSSEDSSDDESSDGAGNVTREVDIEQPEIEPAAAALTAVPIAAAGSDDGEGGDDMDKGMMEAEEEEDFAGKSRYGRTVEGGDMIDEEEGPKYGGYKQLDPPEPPEEAFALRHVERALPPPPEEDPYELEHYVPDGGIIEHERHWEGGYEADGGWNREERPVSTPSERVRIKYEREIKEEPEIVDTRRQRKIEALGDGELWDQLDLAEPEQSAGKPEDMFDWVIRSTLNTLDQKGGELRDER